MTHSLGMGQGKEFAMTLYRSKLEAQRRFVLALLNRRSDLNHSAIKANRNARLHLQTKSIFLFPSQKGGSWDETTGDGIAVA